MSLPHASPGQPIDVRPLGTRLEAAVSSALFKSEQLEVMRLVLPRGKSQPEHEVDGESTIQCLEGEVEVEIRQDVQSKRQLLQAGEMMYLEGGAPHALHARSDTSVLVTIVLKRSS
jgi:quercetin dioxygenase-like cupin family protein